MKKIYLASPYSHPDPSIRQARFDSVCKKAADLMREGYVVFSPIAHSHPISRYLRNPNDADFYLKQDLPLLEMFDEMWVLALSGWKESKGIQIEMEHAKTNNIKTVIVE